VLIVAAVFVALIIIAIVRGTSFYDTFLYFPTFIVSILLGIVMAAFAGVLLGIPVLRLRGDYLAIVTLGFGEIIRLFLNNLKDITGGPQGIVNIPKPAFVGVEMASNEGLVYLVLLGCIFVAFMSLRLKSSRLGRAWSALKSDEDIAQAMGVNLVNTKVLAFAIGAAFAGIGGVIFAARQGSVFPENFTLPISINILALIIIGGMGSIPGVIIGALILIGVPESLRVFENYRVLAFGTLLVAMMLLRPTGLLPQPPPVLERIARLLAGKEQTA
jgi:branched-chain amino acid transport system permease protein